MLADPAILARNELGMVYANFARSDQGFIGVADGQLVSPFMGVSRADWKSMSRPDDRAVVVIRDPRDQIVSYVFSVAYSHAQHPMIDSTRAILLSLPREQWVNFGFYWFQFYAGIIASWFEEQVSTVSVVHYEDLLSDTSAHLERIFAFLNMEVDEEEVCRIAKENSFLAKSGRQTGKEGLKSHLRKGESGDWRNHFSRSQAKLFEELWPGLLLKLGYETDEHWWEKVARPVADA